jgi:hypothetical protein
VAEGLELEFCEYAVKHVRIAAGHCVDDAAQLLFILRKPDDRLRELQQRRRALRSSRTDNSKRRSIRHL